jgi:hypothetical protein
LAGPPAAPEPRDGGREVEEVLLHFSGKEAGARRNYRRFVEDGIEQGRRPDLQGSGFCRNTDDEKLDARMLGSGGFVEKVLRGANEIEGRMKRRIPLTELVQRVSENLQVDGRDLLSGDRRSQVSKARSVVSYIAVREMGYSGVDVGRMLNLSGPGVTKCIEKGKKIMCNHEDLRNRLII